MSDELDLEVPDKLYFRIGEIAGLVGVEPHVLRYWEQEFRMRPPRSPSGQRMYRKKDIARFLQIKRLLYDRKFTIAGAREALRSGKGPGVTADPEALRKAHDVVRALRADLSTLREEIVGAWGDAGVGSP